ncbi:MAG: M81 family metallopeptidase [Acidobacteria bacterium]|nr:M81 family metallopeptidase [Acidobacteriota bacterium]
MRTILVCECKQEISSFNPVLSRYEDFLVDWGEAFLAYHRRVRTEVGGALSVFDQYPDVRLAGGYCARGITSAGTLESAGFARLAREFLDAVRAAGPVDGVYFALHGALAAEDVEDCEGYLLEETRKIVGERLPVSVSFDLHGILTDRMLRHASVASVYHTNPHVDFFETGARAARLLMRLMDGEIRPASIRVPVPALVRGPQCMTATGRIRTCVERASACLSGGMFIGNPFTDVADLGSNVFMTADGDEAATVAEAEAIATEFWNMRQFLQQKLSSLEDSARMAAAATGRVVLIDAADATSSGAPGDSNAIVAELLRQGCQRTVLAPIVDAAAVDQASAAGVGATITVDVGGSLDPRYTPLRVTGVVRVLSDGCMRSESHGEAWYAGRSAVVQCGPATLVLTSRPVSLYDRTLFLANGQDPAAFDMTVVKSPLSQRRFFEEGAQKLINVDAPGATSANLQSLGHTRCARPLWPLDPIDDYRPQARVFRRQA